MFDRAQSETLHFTFLNNLRIDELTSPVNRIQYEDDTIIKFSSIFTWASTQKTGTKNSLKLALMVFTVNWVSLNKTKTQLLLFNLKGNSQENVKFCLYLLLVNSHVSLICKNNVLLLSFKVLLYYWEMFTRAQHSIPTQQTFISWIKVLDEMTQINHICKALLNVQGDVSEVPWRYINSKSCQSIDILYYRLVKSYNTKISKKIYNAVPKSLTEGTI